MAPLGSRGGHERAGINPHEHSGKEGDPPHAAPLATGGVCGACSF